MDDIIRILTNENVETVFEKLPPSHKKEYLKWIDGAKKTETRAARIKKMAQMLKDSEKHRH